jgi:rhamnosyltransferase
VVYKNIAAVVILYHPSEEVVENIKSYSRYVNHTFIIDNSEESNTISEHLSEEKNISYISLLQNNGIAKALNIGINKAISEKYGFVLTMDQDSSFEQEEIEKYLQIVLAMSWSNIGLISPIHIFRKSQLNEKPVIDIEEKESVMTSGNIINSKVFTLVGGFYEPFFIDHVDHEYCARIRESGFKVLQINTIRLRHKLGDSVAIKIFGKSFFSYISHNPVRNYYFVRNGLLLFYKYKSDYSILKLILKEIVKISLFEDNKINRLTLIIKAFKHFKNNITGKYID